MLYKYSFLRGQSEERNYIVNCFKKSKISKEDQQNEAEDIDDPFKKLEDELTQQREIDNTAVPADLSARDLVEIDEDLTTQ